MTKRAHNRLYHKTARNAVKALRATTEKSAAEALLPKVTAMLDKLAKHNIMHKNKAANLKGAIQASRERPLTGREGEDGRMPVRIAPATKKEKGVLSGQSFCGGRAPDHFSPSITAAMRPNTSSIVPTPSTDAYLFCEA